jgi:eukaryotic-like serine/threonine-protein kinase
MGIVFEAIHRPSGRQVALKLLVFPPLIPDEEREGLIARFAREARALASVRHPHVVSVHDVGIVDGQPFMAMEYLVGMNAREWLHRHGPMPPGDLVRIGCQLCSALEAVHAAGIVHRDVKPDNVVLTEDGSVRLTDFGIARMEVEASLTRTGGLIGSPAYMAPEQILGGTVDARSDLFSAGVTLYQLLTGELPFQGTQLMEIAHRVAYDPPRPPVGAPPPLCLCRRPWLGARGSCGERPGGTGHGRGRGDTHHRPRYPFSRLPTAGNADSPPAATVRLFLRYWSL